MKVLVDYESDGHSERDFSTSEPPEAPEQTQVLPDVDAIIRETRTEIEQARLKADQLICQFAEAYVDTAGNFREAAVQRYRERLEGLPAEVCAKVCETLAKDDIFCCNMEFGNGHLSYGGMSFTYKVESDAAFNALSHHAWKDLHQLFMNNESPPFSGNALKEGRAYLAHLHSDDERDGLEPHQDSSPSPSEGSDSSSDEEDFLSTDDSTGAFDPRKGERRRSSVAPSPEWTTDDEIGSSDALKRRTAGQPSKHKGDSDVPEKRGPGRPSSKPWSAEEETLMREKMAIQLQRQGDLIFSSDSAMKMLETFPNRTKSALKNKWLDLKMKDKRDDLEGGREGVLDAKDRGRVKSPVVKKKEKGSASLMESDNGDDDNFNDHGVKQDSHNFTSWVKNKWTPEQDQLLAHRMQSEMQSAGVTKMSVPPAVQKELARSFGRKKKAISRRWYFLSGNGAWNGKGKWKKEKRKSASILAKNEPQVLGQAPALSSRPPPSDASRRSKVTDASGLQRQSQPGWSSWSPQEVETLVRLTKGLSRKNINFKEVVTRLPDPYRRTAQACRVFWQRNVRSPQPDQDQISVQYREAPEKETDSRSKHDLTERSEKGEKRGPNPSSGFGSRKQSEKAKSSSRKMLLQSQTSERRIRLWTRDEDDLLWRLAESGIPWRDVAAQIPNRTESACQVRYSCHLVKLPEYKARLNGRPGRFIRRHSDSRRDPKSDGESPGEADTVISVGGGSKHARESGDEGDTRSAARRKRHRGVPSRSSLRGRDRDDGSDVEDSDVDVYGFE